jgi:hypothetical protein
MRASLRIAHLAVAVLMLVSLFLPLAWASSGTGDYLMGVYFVLFSWSAVPHLMVRFSDLQIGHLVLLSYVVFAGGFVLLTFCSLLSVALARSWLRVVCRTVAAITLLSSLLLASMGTSFLDIGFWLAVGLVGIAGLIELIEYVGSRSKRSPGS